PRRIMDVAFLIVGIGRVAIAEGHSRIGPRAFAGRRHIERAVRRALTLLLVRTETDRTEPALCHFAGHTGLDGVTFGQTTVGHVTLGLRAQGFTEGQTNRAAILVQRLAEGQLPRCRETGLALFVVT